jgi:GNAT superfamily N-acetyltransferase
MSAYRVLERDFDSFFRVPFVQYGDASAYVSPFRADLVELLDGRRNPTFPRRALTYFTVLDGTTPVGRLTAHIHRASNERYGQRTGSFGYFDCGDDPDAARLLLDTACDWLARRRCDEISGNFNLTAMQEMGVVVDGHDRDPFLAQHHNPPWIPALLRRNGFSPYFPMTSWRLDLDRVEAESLLGPKQRAILEDPDFRVEPIRRRGFRSAMDATWRLLNASFEPNPLFVPLTREEFAFQADRMLWWIDSRIAHLLIFRGEPIGVIACLPDVNPLLRATRSRLGWGTPVHYARYRRSRSRASLIFGAVAPEMQNRGGAAVLLHAALTGMRRAGYRELGITWISDSNAPSLRQMEKLGAERHHRLSLFRRRL